MAREVTEEEVEKLQALKVELNKIPESFEGRAWLVEDAGDSTYLRFLRGHKLDVKKAVKLLKKCAKWRASFGTNDILDTWPQNKSKEALLLRKFWPMAITGTDKDGRPVHFFHLSRVDFPTLLKHVPLEMLVRYNVYLLERSLRENPGGEAVMLVDLGSSSSNSPFSLRNVTKRLQSMIVFVKAMAKIADPFYPETYHKIYFCRLHSVLETMFRSMSSNMAENTLSKVKIVNKNDLEKLLETIPSESIPPSLGGTSEARLKPAGLITQQALDEAQADAEAFEKQALDAATEKTEETPGPQDKTEKRASILNTLRASLSKRLSLSSAKTD